jgi:hypothetical protein
MAEAVESVFFILVGLAAFGLSLFFWLRLKQAFYNDMAWPFLAIALIQIVVGTSVYFRSPKDIHRIDTMAQSAPEKIRTEEIPRMEVVMENFLWYKYIEIVLILIGLGLFFFLDASVWRGVGLGLIIQSGFLLLLDFFAMGRGQAYLDELIKM